MKCDAPKWTEAAVYECLPSHFKGEAWVLLPQVRNGTGFAKRRVSTADAIDVSVWPSRGLYLHGIEIKVSRSDWVSELTKPEKSAEIQQYCQYWSVAAPKGMIPIGEVPATWGLIECHGDKASVTKPAPELKPVAPDILLVCSILRSVAKVTVPADAVESRAQQLGEAIARTRLLTAEHDIKELEGRIERFESASGVSLQDRWQVGRIGDAVRMVLDGQGSSIRAKLRVVERYAAQIRSMALLALGEQEEAGADE